MVVLTRGHAPASHARAQHLCIYAKQGPPCKYSRWPFFLWSKAKCSETLAVLLCFGIASEAAAVVLCFVYLRFPFTNSWLPETLRRGGFHYTSEVGFSEPVADYIIRNPRSKWNLRSESLEKFHKSQVNSSIWLPPLQTLSESCKLHHLLAPRPVFCAIKKSHWQSCATPTHSYVFFFLFSHRNSCMYY